MTPSQPQMNTCSDHDIELLSCYLDDQLAEQDRTHLETRLVAEPALQNCLDELHTTVLLLRELDPVLPPRSFTLDPADVAPQHPRWRGWLHIGGVMATVLLAITITAIYGMTGNSMTNTSGGESIPVAMHNETTTQLKFQEEPTAADIAAVEDIEEEAVEMAAEEAAEIARPTTHRSIRPEEGVGASPAGTPAEQPAPPSNVRPALPTPHSPRPMVVPTRTTSAMPTVSVGSLSPSHPLPAATEPYAAGGQPSPGEATPPTSPTSSTLPPPEAPAPNPDGSLLMLAVGGVLLVGGGVGLLLWIIRRQGS